MHELRRAEIHSCAEEVSSSELRFANPPLCPYAPLVQSEIDRFLLYLATEAGLSTNYQLSNQRSLEGFAAWAEKIHQVMEVTAVRETHLTEFLSRVFGYDPPRH